MVNTRRKGRRAELKVVKELEKASWLIYQVKGSTRFNKNVDIFSLFDIMSVRKENNIQKRKWIQVKHRKPVLTPFKEFKEKCCDSNDSVEIWVWKKDKSTRKKAFEITIVSGESIHPSALPVAA